jgi:hypothetical protein
MRGNTAYIRIWKRAGTAQQAANTAPATNASADSQQELRDQLEAAIENRDSVANNYDPVKGTYGFNPYGDVDNPIEVAEANIQTLEAQIDFGRQQALASQTPTSSTAQTTQSNVATPQPRGASVAKGAALGTVKSANPNGFWGSLGRVGSALIGLPIGPTAYSGGAMGAGTTAPATGEMMWQFLFNPSELELEVGPEFKNAETWGVSDKGNSGQPLHWSHNKNAQLKFNSVLLNGFVFGRKVEALEQGLIELFMARDGEGQHGPHVLEFVWGKRVFGPCVIKNVNIKEKMWDEGEVVNAELSFTLEQVPEWTINDGFVDVARPGRLATEGNPAVSGSSANNPSGQEAPGGDNQDSGAGSQPGQKPPAPAGVNSSGAQLCDWALGISKQFQQLYVKVNNPLTAAAFGDFNSQVSQFYSLKNSLYSGSSEVGSFVDSRVSSGCKKSSYRSTVEDLKKTGGNLAISAQQQTIQFIRGCTESTKRAVDEWHKTSSKCKAQREAGAAGRVDQQQRDLCARYSGRCSRPGERFGTAGQCPFVNNGRGVICSGGVWTPL